MNISKLEIKRNEALELYKEATRLTLRFRIEYRLEHENLNNDYLIKIYWLMSHRQTRRYNQYMDLCIDVCNENTKNAILSEDYQSYRIAR